MCEPSYKQLIEKARDAFHHGKTRPVGFRTQQLKSLKRLLKDHDEEIFCALQKDLCKQKSESILTEVNEVNIEVDCALKNIREWVGPKKGRKTVMNLLDDVTIHSDPLGLVLIIGSWNYPLKHIVIPLVGAIAAGNCVVIKPSEISEHTSDVLADAIPDYLDNDCYPVVTGNARDAETLLKEPFDHVMFAGSNYVAKSVTEMTSEYLPSYTTDIGGKSPVYLDNTVDMIVAAKRIMWGKLLNAGQNSVAPDYVLCTKEVADKFLCEAQKWVINFYGTNPQNSDHYARIISEKHYRRLVKLLDRNKVAVGGTHDCADRYISPTIMTDVCSKDNVMKEEIFGPILPIVYIDHPDDAVEFIHSQPRPGAFYIFSKNKKCQEFLMHNVLSGSVVVNHTLVQTGIPFGRWSIISVGCTMKNLFFHL